MKLFQKDYDRPGKGVLKNESEKKGFFRFFELFFRNFWMLVSTELWYILLSLPLVTNGLANVGMTYVCRMAARDKHVFVTSDFFGTIKKNWKRALPLGILNLILELVIFVNLWLLYVYWTNDNLNKTFILIILVVTMFFFSMFSFAKYYQYTLLITFDFKLKTVIKNSWLFATVGLLRNFLIGGVLTLIYVFGYILLCLNFQVGLTIVIVFSLFILPAFRMFLIQFNVFPVIRKFIIDPYYIEHPDEDIEKRRELGIYEGGDDDESSVFNDSESKN